jgi:hypothetical protein
MAMTDGKDQGIDAAVLNGQGPGDTKDVECDVLIIGAGFGGVYMLHKLRDEHKMNVKVLEAGSDLGYVLQSLGILF